MNIDNNKQNKFSIGELVCHKSVYGKKFRIVKEINPSQYEIEDVDTKLILLEPIDCILGLVEYREYLLDYILDTSLE